MPSAEAAKPNRFMASRRWIIAAEKTNQKWSQILYQYISHKVHVWFYKDIQAPSPLKLFNKLYA
jgi:hypothetical protein